MNKRKLLVLGCVSLLAASAMPCTINVVKKKPAAKSAFLKNGESISRRMMEKLSGQCEIKVRIMTRAELRAHKIMRLKKRLKKLSSEKY